ncbi:helix-turn-helix domain-containing protein [Streptomyces sp. NPDC096205]|uniref:helix-turn-helix domain-containing protein n=1 Tax=Streptomyces sp. NPDC096205 TaxID=3366081 RepID=UPI0038305185
MTDLVERLVTEARRVRAAELFEQGRPSAVIARMLVVSDESVRRWKWEEGGADALRRRPATGRPPKRLHCVQDTHHRGTPPPMRGAPRTRSAPRGRTRVVEFTPPRIAGSGLHVGAEGEVPGPVGCSPTPDVQAGAAGVPLGQL